VTPESVLRFRFADPRGIGLYALRMPKMGELPEGIVLLRCWANKGVREGRSPYRSKDPGPEPA
jgi:hypothetical protein